MGIQFSGEELRKEPSDGQRIWGSTPEKVEKKGLVYIMSHPRSGTRGQESFNAWKPGWMDVGK